MKAGNSKKQKSEKPLSLAPLSFKDAVSALLRVKPDEDRPTKRGKKPPKQDKPEPPED